MLRTRRFDEFGVMFLLIHSHAAHRLIESRYKPDVRRHRASVRLPYICIRWLCIRRRTLTHDASTSIATADPDADVDADAFVVVVVAVRRATATSRARARANAAVAEAPRAPPSPHRWLILMRL